MSLAPIPESGREKSGNNHSAPLDVSAILAALYATSGQVGFPSLVILATVTAYAIKRKAR
ncbi:MAG: hypothetical protein JWN86_1421 [Planctomycetota bacterium]|nr:hypothetical protein [Planctomycetota bacterium]